MTTSPHIPVLLNEVLQYIKPQDGEVYVDATFGNGGYTEAILKAANCKVIALDRDKTVLKRAAELQEKYGERFEFVNIDFAQIGKALESIGVSGVNGIVYDIGVSSMQIDNKERGFSFQADAALDMRMDQSQELSAYDVVNNYPEKILADLIYEYGDERKSRRIAKFICEARNESPITSTLQLVDLVNRAVGYYRDEINPATRTFQAIRIEVNQELSQLKSSLQHAKSLLKSNGRLVVVTFHSGEDKIVKKFFNDLIGKMPNANRYDPFQVAKNEEKSFTPLHKGTVVASFEEVANNPRSRSAKLRALMKI